MAKSRHMILIFAGLIVIAIAIFLSRSASRESPPLPAADTSQPAQP